ncbi:MAG: NAD-dependent epimerase/dehydratase family protein [Spartobacteria bacterium]
MRRVLIAGCGYVGQAAADLFLSAGWEVEGWTRTATSIGKNYPVVAVDLEDREQVKAQPGDFDAVIHCAGTRGGDVDLYRRTYLDGARNLIDRFVRSTILFTSSTSVYAQRSGEVVTEESPAEPERATSQILRETEKLVLHHGGIVARLAGIYGPGRSALLKKILSGEASIDPENDRFINQVQRDDVAAALCLLLDRQSTSGEIFNVADDRPVLVSDCYRWLAERLQKPLPEARSTSSRRRGDSNKRVSNAKLRGLGWEPSYPSFVEGMERSVFPSDLPSAS